MSLFKMSHSTKLDAQMLKDYTVYKVEQFLRGRAKVV